MDKLQTLRALLVKFSKDIQRDVLAASVVFPKTDSLRDDTPIAVIQQSSLDFDAAIDFVKQHPELIALSAREDLVQVLGILQQVQEEMSLDQFDGVQIYRGGLDLLLIENTSRAVGRSAFIEVNDYRRRLQRVAMQQLDYSNIVSLLSVAMVCASAICIALLRK